jgi:hypothetical protein
MTGTLGANAMWDWMPFMAGLNGEEGPHAHGNPVHGVERKDSVRYNLAMSTSSSTPKFT